MTNTSDPPRKPQTPPDTVRKSDWPPVKRIPPPPPPPPQKKGNYAAPNLFQPF